MNVVKCTTQTVDCDIYSQGLSIFRVKSLDIFRTGQKQTYYGLF